MKYVLILLLAVTITVQAGVFGSEKVAAGTNSPEKDYDSVNGSITVGEKSHVDNLDTVNGSIKVGNDAIVGKAETVNGSIKFADGVTAEHAETVNGSINLGANCLIKSHAETVNGKITADKGCQIEGNVETVNGKISAVASVIEGSIKTVNGDIFLEDGTIVEGDVFIDKSSGWFNSNNKVPEVHIGEDVVVKGDLIFKKEVKLFVDKSAEIGDVVGDKVIRD